MKSKMNEKSKPEFPERNTSQSYHNCGAGNWLARIHNQRNRKGDTYSWFDVVRIKPGADTIATRFYPEDVLSMPRFIEVLASALAEGGYMASEIRDDLRCLAACLRSTLGENATDASVAETEEVNFYANGIDLPPELDS